MDCFLRDQTQAIRIIVWIATEKVTVHSVTSNRKNAEKGLTAYFAADPSLPEFYIIVSSRKTSASRIFRIFLHPR